MRDEEGGLIKAVHGEAVNDTVILEERFPGIGWAAYPVYFCANLYHELKEDIITAMINRKP